MSKEDNEAVIGASIRVTGTNIGTITDADGRFTLSDIPAGKTITVSFIGMVTQTLPVSKDNVVVYLESDSKLLDEVMVVAYGTAKKSSFTGSAAVVKSDKIDQRPLTTATGVLLGATPGVQVSSANGQPGSESSIYIRGIGSFSASNTPLIILNGMPYDNAISSINPGDIESISVLKDASSASLYGARAANGVVLINTKQGNKDRTSVNVKFNQGFTSRQTADYKTLGIEDFLLIHWEDFRNQKIKGGMTAEDAAIDAAKNLITGRLMVNPFNVADDQVVDASGKLNPNATFMWPDDTNWLDAIQQLGNRSEATVNISGGTQTSDYYLSVGALSESGYVIGSAFDRYTMNTNINSQITSFLKVGGTLSGNLSESKGNQDEGSNTLGNPFRFARYVGPIYAIHLHDTSTKEYLLDDNGNKRYDFGESSRPYISDANPAIDLQNRYDGYRRNTLNAKTYAEIRFLNDFKFTVNGSVGANAYLSNSAGVYYPEKDNQGTVTSTKTNTFTTTWTFNQLLSYSKDFGKHHVDALVGHESYSWTYNYLTAQKKGMRVASDNYEFGNYNEISNANSYTNKYSTEGYLTRVNYDYDNRYFVSASLRRDGSSRFYKDARWGNFFSFGAGWRIDKEAFMSDLTFVDLLKLRLSYGEVGNDDIGTYYGWQTMYTLSPNGTEAGYIQDNTVRSKELQWEKSQSKDLALEFELFKNRLSGSVEYFDRQSSNLLFEVPQPVEAGFTSKWQNAGTMYNRGVELELNGKPVQTKDLTWAVGFNAMFLTNKITSLPVDPYNDGTHRVEEGHSRYEFYLRQWEGVNPATGDNIYLPTDEVLATYNDPATTDAARDALSIVDVDGTLYTTKVANAKYDWSGVSSPKMAGGFNTAVSWKGLTLSLQFNYQLGGKFYDSGYASLMTQPYGYPLGSTRHVDILKRWQKEGDITSVPRLDISTDNADMNASTSTRWLTSSDLLELSNVTLSYDIPKPLLNRFSVHGLRVYASGDNLMLLTARQGIYPRRNIFSGTSGNVDVYMPARVFTLGLNLTF